jgi:histone-binding protein RBBP4
MSVVPGQRAVRRIFQFSIPLIDPFGHIRNPQKPYTTHRLLLGTHTSGQSQDYLQIATVQIPKRDNPATGADKLDRADYDDERGELGGHSLPPTPRIQIIQKINHDGEVNRARYMPQNPDLIATKTVTGDVFIFDRTKHSSEPERGGLCKPDIKLIGQHREGCVPLFSDSA